MILKLFISTFLLVAIEILKIKNLGYAAIIAPSPSILNGTCTNSTNSSKITNEAVSGSSSTKREATTIAPLSSLLYETNVNQTDSSTITNETAPDFSSKQGNAEAIAPLSPIFNETFAISTESPAATNSTEISTATTTTTSPTDLNEALPGSSSAKREATTITPLSSLLYETNINRTETSTITNDTATDTQGNALPVAPLSSLLFETSINTTEGSTTTKSPENLAVAPQGFPSTQGNVAIMVPLSSVLYEPSTNITESSSPVNVTSPGLPSTQGNVAIMVPVSSLLIETSSNITESSTTQYSTAPELSYAQSDSTTPAPDLPSIQSDSTTPAAENDATTETLLAANQTAQNAEHLENLPILTHSTNDSAQSALVRRHGDIKGTNEIHKETANMKKVKTVVMSSEAFDETTCHINQRGPLYRLYGNSKYFADSDNLYNYKQAKEICEDNGLDLAEVEDMEDHRSVQNFVKNFLITGKSARHFYIGANDFKEKGIFVHGDGEPLKFQNFLLSEPDDKDQKEDCVALMQEGVGGPVGAADVDCKEEGNVLCMFPPSDECYKESKETEENEILQRKKGLVFIADIVQAGTYHVSNFMLTWNQAFHYCLDRNMTLFSLDNKYITRQMFFRELFKWEQKFVKVDSIPFQFWTNGRFQTSHLTAPVFFATKPLDKESSEEGSAEFSGEPESPHHYLNWTYAFSGVYMWSDMKKRDPGGAHNLRRDLCLSFAFERFDETPVVRNTNCEIPQFFLCLKEAEKEEEEEE